MYRPNVGDRDRGPSPWVPVLIAALAFLALGVVGYFVWQLAG